jgi:hypothetical protein
MLTFPEDCSKNPNCHSAAGEESHTFLSSQKIEKEILRTSSSG